MKRSRTVCDFRVHDTRKALEIWSFMLANAEALTIRNSLFIFNVFSHFLAVERSCVWWCRKHKLDRLWMLWYRAPTDKRLQAQKTSSEKGPKTARDSSKLSTSHKIGVSVIKVRVHNAAIRHWGMFLWSIWRYKCAEHRNCLQPV